jgi:hypothetical protein
MIARFYLVAFALVFCFRRVCDRALAAADFAARLALGLRITFDAACATFFDVFRFGDFLCDNTLPADFFAFLPASGLLNTLPARLATLRPVPLIGILIFSLS